MVQRSRSKLFASQRVAVHGRLFGALVALTALACAAVVAVALVTAGRRVREATRSAVGSTLDVAEEGVRRFLEPIERQIVLCGEQGARGLLAEDAARGPEAVLLPVLRSMPQVSSLIVARPGGRELMLLEQGDHLLARRIDVQSAPGRATLSKLALDGSVRETEVTDLAYDPGTRPWYVASMKAPGTVRWTEPYRFFTTGEPGITTALTFREPGETGPSVIAFDLLLRDLSTFTMGLDVSERGKVVLVDAEGRVLGLPRDRRFEDAASRNAAVLAPCDAIGVPAARDALRHYQEHGMAGPFRFESGDEWWWAGARRIELSGERELRVAVLTPEADFLGDYHRSRNLLLVLSVVAVLLAGAIAILLSRRLEKEVDAAVDEARELGQYTLEEEIGAGAMGTVYRARHSMLSRPTAIKLLKPEATGSEAALARFVHEAEMTSRLTHPNTIAVYDFGQTPDGVFYYAMEYVEGVTLKRLVETCGPLSAGRAIHVLEQVCGSLHEAHEAGMVHRDVKPANIMLCRRGGVDDVVKVLDFGLVRHSEESLEKSAAESPKGTPLFMSPEAFSAPRDVDHRADLYAIGAVAYYLVTGRPPFAERDLSKLLMKILAEDPAPPGEHLDEPLPPDLEEAILACLRKQPEARPASARELSDRLERCAARDRWNRPLAAAWWSTNAALLE